VTSIITNNIVNSPGTSINQNYAVNQVYSYNTPVYSPGPQYYYSYTAPASSSSSSSLGIILSLTIIGGLVIGLIVLCCVCKRRR
jgi:hypothetical protein